MGVGKGFWDVLKPVARMESLDSLRGKVLAIDLSFWMIQLLSRVKGISLRKPHIRLLFFRTIHLVAKIGAFPVFVADGEPPPLKLQVRLNRFSRISGSPLNTFVGDPNCKMARSSLFMDSIDECVELLELLGMPVLRAKHEAEGLCAELQKQGLVSACVTPDSDAFLYGAEHVIKVLQADLKDPHVESYMMKDVETFLGLHREHLVALALLAGCDYDVSGVPGIGCQNAVRLIKAVPKHQVFDRLRDWGTGKFEHEADNGGLIGDNADLKGCRDKVATIRNGDHANLKKEPHCSSCGHPGTKKAHIKYGCEECKSNDILSNAIDKQGCRPKGYGFKCTCQYCTQKEVMKKQMKHEGWKMKVCHKIFETQGFPNEKIIEIFMEPEHDTLSGDVKPSLAWKSPCVEALETFLGDHLLWDKVYVRRKLLPLLSFYCLKDTAAMRNLGTLGQIVPSINGLYVPHSIQRIKILFAKPLFRLRWSARDTKEDWLCLKSLLTSQDKKADDDLDMVSELQTENLNNHLLFTTDEDMMLVKEAYPELVSWFEQEQEMRKIKSKSNSKRKGESRRKVNVDDLSGKQLRITSFFQSKKVGACSHDAKETSDIAAQGQALDDKNTWCVRRNLDTCKEVEPSIKEEAAAVIQGGRSFVKQDGSAREIARAIVMHEGNDVLKDTHEEDQQKLVYAPRASMEDGGNRNSRQNSRDKADVGVIKEAGNKPEVVLIDDVDIVDVYPCKANRLGNHSPGFQAARQQMSSGLKVTIHDGVVEVTDVDTTPPLRCWRELYEGKMNEIQDSPRAWSRPRRVLFS